MKFVESETGMLREINEISASKGRNSTCSRRESKYSAEKRNEDLFPGRLFKSAQGKGEKGTRRRTARIQSCMLQSDYHVRAGKL